MSIIEELYNGNICPSEKFIRKGGEYCKLLARCTECVERLTEKLDDEGQLLWDEIREMETNMKRLSDRESFIDGFCIGMRLMSEIMDMDRTDRNVL